MKGNLAKRLGVVATTATMIATMLVGLGSAASAAPAGIAWGPCSDPTLQQVGAECGYLAVPLDYARPNGQQIRLAVSRVKHKVPDSQYQGIMLTNPGGPGGSGLVYSFLGQFVPNGAGDFYDWIGFDPRGVGASIPSLHCDPNYFAGPRPDYVPWNRGLEQAWLNRSKGYAQACGRDGGALLNHMTTIDSAKDMDGIRAALGEQKINYYGFSYGTYLGQVYASLYPQKVRRMVWDANVDPRDVWYQANFNQDLGFDRNIKIWFGWLARFDSVYHLGSTEAAVERLWYSEQFKLRAKPAGGVIGPDEWTDIFLGAAYYQLTWLGLADLLANYVQNRDPAPLIDEYNSGQSVGDDNNFAVYNAVTCSDTKWPADWEKYRRDNWLTFLRAPFATWDNAWFNGPCLFWPAAGHQLAQIDGKHVPGILLVDETLDSATPYKGSVEVRKRFPNSRLLALPGGTTHAGSLFGNECEDGMIADYLATGALPTRKAGDGPDATCDPLPQPDPTALAGNRSSLAGTPHRPVPKVRF